MIYIDQALISRFIDGNFGLPIAHENMAYAPAAGTAYAELLVLQNDVTALTLKHSNATDGVFRVILRYPLEVGAVIAKQKADQIFDFYKLGQRLEYASDSLTITSNSRQVGVAEDGWYKLVLSMSYKAFFGR